MHAHMHTYIHTYMHTYIHVYTHTYAVSRVTYTDEYRACIWTSLGEFRYERYESVFVTLLTISVLLSLYYFSRIPNHQGHRHLCSLFG